MRLSKLQREKYKAALEKLGWTQEYYSELLNYKTIRVMQCSAKYHQWVDLLINVVDTCEKVSTIVDKKD